MMEDSDAAVVDRILGGDLHAFRILVERHSHAVFRLAFRMTGNEQDAEDVVQEAFLRAFRRLAHCEQRSLFSAWLLRIAANCSFDLLRKRMRQPLCSPLGTAAGQETDLVPSPGPGPDVDAARADLQKQIESALAWLSAQERCAFVLRHMEGRSIPEISAALNLRASATRNSVFRAVKKIRAALEPILNETIHEPLK